MIAIQERPQKSVVLSSVDDRIVTDPRYKDDYILDVI
jgi:hypothetical protein